MNRHTSEKGPSPLMSADSKTSEFPRPTQLWVILAGYFAIQVISRVTFSSSVDLDESEAVVLAQKFSLGYGPVPPLYTWLQMVVFRIFGESVLGLSVLKNALLLCIYVLAYVVARVVTRTSAASIAASLSLLFLPNIAWESQRDLSHSILAAMFSVATLLCFLKLHERKGWGSYAVFGLCAGCGLLSKYNYGLWLAGLVVAGTSLAEMRSSVLNRRMLLALALMLALFVPFGLWMLEHRELATVTSSKFEFNQALPWSKVAGRGLKNVLQAVLAYCGPIAGVYFVIFFRAARRLEAQPVKKYQSLMARAWFVILAGLCVWIVLSRATEFKERWFQPILVSLPVFAISLVQTRLSPVRLRVLAVIALFIMTVVAVVMPGRLFLAERLGREEPLTRPYAELATQLRPVIPPGSLLACDTRILAGNLRMNLQHANVLDPNLPDFFAREGRPCFLVWDARQQDAPPERLLKWANLEAGSGFSTDRAQYFKAVYRYHKTKEFRIGLFRLQ